MPPRDRRQTNRDTDDYTKKSFELLLTYLRDNGAEPHRVPARPGTLASACLLPDCPRTTKTSLTIDGQTAHYHCNACSADGTPTTYMARMWKISASNAHALIDHYPINALRNGRPHMTQEMLETRQDTYPLGVAMEHYISNLQTSYTALQWLTKLAITPETAKAARVGYSTGENLRQHLLNESLTEEQIRDTSLFVPQSGEERFAGNIVVGDADHTGAITWIISTNPARDIQIPGYRLDANPPSVSALPTKGRTAVLGLQRSYERTKPTLLTDDVRAYLAAMSTGAQAVLIVHRPRREDPEAMQRRLDFTAEIISNRTRMKSLVIATHHSNISAGLRDRIEARLPNTPILAAGKAMTLRLASPATRNFQALFNEDTFKERAQKARAQLGHDTSPNGTATDQNGESESQKDEQDE